MLWREQRFKTSEHESRCLALLPLASLSPCGTLLGCGKPTQNVLRIKMCQNTRGPMIGWILGLANSAFSDIDKGFSISQLCILWMSAWASCYLPLDDSMTAAAPGIMSSRRRGPSHPCTFFKERKQAPGAPQYIFIHACWLDWVTTPLLSQPLEKGLGVPELAQANWDSF